MRTAAITVLEYAQMIRWAIYQHKETGSAFELDAAYWYTRYSCRRALLEARPLVHAPLRLASDDSTCGEAGPIGAHAGAVTCPACREAIVRDLEAQRAGWPDKSFLSAVEDARTF
jgi:predicted RNA-binding Zn-ribbon protein involved in translation (DUF1610 family)